MDRKKSPLAMCNTYSMKRVAVLIRNSIPHYRIFSRELSSSLFALLFAFLNNNQITFYQLYWRFIGNYLPIIGTIRIIEGLIGTYWCYPVLSESAVPLMVGKGLT